MKLPSYILWKIWTFIGPKAYFLDKHVISIITHKRKLFIEKPLRVYYKLCRWKKKHYNHASHSIGRPTLYIEPVKHIDISGEYLGKVNKDSTLQISQKIENKLIPSSAKNISNGFRLSILYWTIDSAWTVDPRTKLYSLLWPIVLETS
jgi:hypothetical protein